MRQSQSVVELSASSSKNVHRGSGIYLPPLNNSTLSIDMSNISKYSKVPNDRFKEPESVRKIKEIVPVSYLNNFNTFSQSINKSTSNLTKAKRFSIRDIYEKDLGDLPSPSSYNLSYLNSITQKAQATKESQIKEKLSEKKRFDRFKDKTYFRELDRGHGDNSPGPGAYQKADTDKLPSVRKSCETLFGKADRKLMFRKEDKESPSPTKYNVRYEFKGTRNLKGASFGTAPKTFSMF